MPTPGSDDTDPAATELQRQLAGDDVRDAARALLEPGEDLVELAEVAVAFGHWGPVDEWQPVELHASGWLARFWAFATATAVRKAVTFILLAPLAVLAWVDSLGASLSDLPDRVIGGVVCAGPRDSSARRLQHALSPLGGRGTHLLVTGRRLVVGWRRLSGPPSFTAAVTIPIAEVAAARRRPRHALRRRVELVFADGSRVILAVPALRHPPSKPGRLVAAIAGARPGGGGSGGAA